MNIYSKLKDSFEKLIVENNLIDEDIIINVKSLTPEESIGTDTKRQDFPILTGKESMIEADFKGAKGQAFTTARVSFSGQLAELLNLDIGEDPYDTGLFISALNAVMRYLGLITGTIHCQNQEPEICAEKLLNFVKDNFCDKKIALVGYQPAMLEALSKGGCNIRNLDLNPKNIGENRYGIVVEDGEKNYEEVINNWADVVLCTGSTIINGSIVNYSDLNIPVLFYGNTIAGPAKCLGLNRLCYCAL